MKQLILYFTILLLPMSLFAQMGESFLVKVGFGYTLGKSTNNAFEVNMSVNYWSSEYVFFGSKISFTKLKEDSSPLINIGPELGLNVIKLSEKILNKQHQDIDAQTSLFLGFNLDKNNKQQKRFLFSKSVISASIYSNKVLNGHLFLGYNLNNYHQLESLKSLNTAEIGGYFSP